MNSEERKIWDGLLQASGGIYTEASIPNDPIERKALLVELANISRMDASQAKAVADERRTRAIEGTNAHQRGVDSAVALFASHIAEGPEGEAPHVHLGGQRDETKLDEITLHSPPSDSAPQPTGYTPRQLMARKFCMAEDAVRGGNQAMALDAIDTALGNLTHELEAPYLQREDAASYHEWSKQLRQHRDTIEGEIKWRGGTPPKRRNP